MQIVGTLSEQVAALLQIDLPDDPHIYFGETNRIHMLSDHPAAYEKYGELIPEIDEEYVKVAVRAASSDRLYARTLYVLNRGRAEHFIASGKLIPVSD